jgi:hypothetical protein
MQALDHAITRFLGTLIPPHQLDMNTPREKHALIVIHTLAHTATINLYSRFAREDPVSYEKCLSSARFCVAVIKHIADADFTFLEPVIGPCWTCAADILIRELDNFEASWPLLSSADVRLEISSILFALSNLSAQFPLFAFSAAKIQKRLAQV